MDISVQNKAIKRSKPRKVDFEELYVAVRGHENRVYTDAQLQTLPDFYIHSNEWDVRKHSSDRLLAYLGKKRKFLRILEVGCGNGWLSAKMAGLPKTYITGLDINMVEISQASRVFKKPNLEFVYDSFNENTFDKEKFEAVIWCPESNYFLLNKTAAADDLKKHTTILFGTDSTLTGNWNIWNHIRLARKTNMLTDAELYSSLHLGGSSNWQTNADNKGSIVVTKKNDTETPFDSFYATQPEDILLVVNDGQVRLFDNTMLSQLEHLDLKQFSKVFIGRTCKYVQGDLPGLMQQIKVYYPGAVFPVTAI